MTDPRYLKLAKLLVHYSTQIKKGDRVLLDMIDVPDEFSIALMRAVRAVGGMPFIEVRHTRITREILCETNGKHAVLLRDLVQLGRRALADGVHVGGRMGLINRNELFAKTQSNDSDIDLSVVHACSRMRTLKS